MILILDYGSQYTLLIARRVREMGVYSEVWPCNDPRVEDQVLAGESEHDIEGIILSGGPASVTIEGAPALAGGLLELGIPILGICYGMQAISHALGASISPATVREYGRTELIVEQSVGLLDGFDVGAKTQVWMSHGDSVEDLPEGFERIATTENGVLAAIGNTERAIYGVQFHPEVAHTTEGAKMLENFVFGVCESAKDWELAHFLDEEVARIQERVGEDERVICGLSGGVDSSVVAAILHRAIGERLTGSPRAESSHQ